MNNKNKKIRKDIIREIEQYSRHYCVGYAKEASKQLTHYAKTAIEQFYLDYQLDYSNPNVYHRTFNLLHDSYKRYYKHAFKYCDGGVKISAEDMYEYSYGRDTTPDDVVGWTWFNGYHGYEWSGSKYGKRNITSTRITEPPYLYVMERMNSGTLHNYLHKCAIEYANKAQFYNYLFVYGD